jgi:hypothetical protein
MRNMEYFLRIERRMAAHRLDPTRDDFAKWVKETNAFKEERRALFLELHTQGKTYGELLDQLTEMEFFRWYLNLDCRMEERAWW